MTGMQKTAEILLAMMNSVYKTIQFTIETKDDFKSGTLPTLDTQLWTEDQNKIWYSYYEKPTSAKLVVAKKSAMSENGKVASLSQDLVRRLKNTSLGLSQEQKNEIINQYSRKLVTSGYQKEQVRRIITAGLKGFERLLERQVKGSQDIHRPAAKGAAARNKAKLLGKAKWFKPKNISKECADKHQPSARIGGRKDGKDSRRRKEEEKGGQKQTLLETTTVLFVEQTPGGILAQKFREAEVTLSKLTGFKVKIVEKTGSAVKNARGKDVRHARQGKRRAASREASSTPHSVCHAREKELPRSTWARRHGLGMNGAVSTFLMVPSSKQIATSGSTRQLSMKEQKQTSPSGSWQPTGQH